MSDYDTGNVINSITNSKSTVFDDSQSPYTLLEWVNKTSNDPGGVDKYIDEYNSYVKQWRLVTNDTSSQNDASIKDTYIRFLKEVAINYTTQEEKRYFSNIDLSSANEADAAIPFFAKRIREIIQIIHNNRQQAKFQKIKYSFKGNKIGVDKAIFDQLIRYVTGETLINHVLPSKEQITRHTRTRIVEKYDTTQDYFDTQYMHTPGGEYVDDQGVDYVGYYHEQLLADGRKQLITGKCGTTDDSRPLAHVTTGYVYGCHAIKIVSVAVADVDTPTRYVVMIQSNNCDHWTYTIDDDPAIAVTDSSSVVLDLPIGQLSLTVNCVDQHGVTRAIDNVLIDTTTNYLIDSAGDRMEIEGPPDGDYLLWA